MPRCQGGGGGGTLGLWPATYCTVATSRASAAWCREPAINNGEGRTAMNAITAERNGSGPWAAVVQRWRRLAWLALLIADAGLLSCGVPGRQRYPDTCPDREGPRSCPPATRGTAGARGTSSQPR